MSAKGFEFSGFCAPPVEREFFPQEGMKPGEGIMLQLNLDHLSLERMDLMDARFNEIFDGSMSIMKMIEGVVEEANPKPKSKKLAAAAEKPKPVEVPKIELFTFEKARTRFYIEMLAGEPGNTDPFNRLVHGWNVTRDGQDVPVSYETFSQLPPHGLKRLWHFVMGEANNPTAQEKKQ